jgi:AcrR family transcriptional regulator
MSIPSLPLGTRELIFESALEVFAAQGLAGARVDDIAEKAGLNKANLYRLFGSKSALFESCVEWSARQLNIGTIETASDLENYAVNLLKTGVEDNRILRLFLWASLEGFALPGGNDWESKTAKLAADMGITPTHAAVVIYQVITNAISPIVFSLPQPRAVNQFENAVRAAVRGIVDSAGAHR